MKSAVVAIIAGATIIGSSPANAGDCSSANSPDLIGQAEVQNLRNNADAAEQRASMANNPQERARWEAMAQNFRSQADNLERQQQQIADGVRRICEVATKHDGDGQ